MPKSSSFTSPSAVDDDVGRLDVAMDDEVAVRVLDCRRRPARNRSQPLLDASGAPRRSTGRCGRPSMYSITRYGRPSRGLRRRRGGARCSRASSEARMRRSRRNRCAISSSASARLDELQRSLLLELPVVAFREVHGPHPAAADFAEYAPDPDLLAGREPARDRLLHAGERRAEELRRDRCPVAAGRMARWRVGAARRSLRGTPGRRAQRASRKAGRDPGGSASAASNRASTCDQRRSFIRQAGRCRALSGATRGRASSRAVPSSAMSRARWRFLLPSTRRSSGTPRHARAWG